MPRYIYFSLVAITTLWAAACSSPTELDTPRSIITDSSALSYTVSSAEFGVSASLSGNIPYDSDWAGGITLRKDGDKLLLSIPRGSLCTVQPAYAAVSEMQSIAFVCTDIPVNKGTILLNRPPTGGSGATLEVEPSAAPPVTVTTEKDVAEIRIDPVHDAGARTLALAMQIHLSLEQALGPPVVIDLNALLSIEYIRN